MERTSFKAMNCSVAQCLEVVGEWWSLLIVRDVFLGHRRFDEFLDRLGISRNTLAARLRKLVEAGILERVAYQERPPRHEYRLTDKGRDLWPVINAMRQWGDRHSAPGGAPLQLIHRGCGQVTEALLVCSGCGVRLTSSGVRAIPGPGASRTA